MTNDRRKSFRLRPRSEYDRLLELTQMMKRSGEQPVYMIIDEWIDRYGKQ